LQFDVNLNRFRNFCVVGSNCSSGTWGNQDPTGWICQKCDSRCTTCTGATLDLCTGCTFASNLYF
jgi:hypothetical protein